MVEPLLSLSYDQFIHPSVQASIASIVNLLRLKNDPASNSFAEFADYLCKLAAYADEFNESNHAIAESDEFFTSHEQLRAQLLSFKVEFEASNAALSSMEKKMKETTDSINEVSIELEILNAKIAELTARQSRLTESHLVDYFAAKETSRRIDTISQQSKASLQRFEAMKTCVKSRENTRAISAKKMRDILTLWADVSKSFSEAFNPAPNA